MPVLTRSMAKALCNASTPILPPRAPETPRKVAGASGRRRAGPKEALTVTVEKDLSALMEEETTEEEDFQTPCFNASGKQANAGQQSLRSTPSDKKLSPLHSKNLADETGKTIASRSSSSDETSFETAFDRTFVVDKEHAQSLSPLSSGLASPYELSLVDETFTSDYDITHYEDIEEDNSHQDNKKIPEWVKDDDTLTIQLFKQVHARETQADNFLFPPMDSTYRPYPNILPI